MRGWTIRSLFLILLAPALAFGEPPAASPGPGPAQTNVAYRSDASPDAYECERCRLDVYLPPGGSGFATLVWFHGGGLTAGSKDGKETRAIAQSLARAGVAVVVPNYRLSPKVKYPAYIEDAAAAVAWTRTHVADLGGDPARVYVGGHSAGGYLTLMLAMDARYLAACGQPPGSVAGWIPVSGQTMTHFTVREERGIGKFTIVADEAAPVYHARKDPMRMLVLWADRDMTARAEENAYFVALMKGAGCPNVAGLCIPDRDHGSVARKIAEDDDPARRAMLEFMAR